MKIEIIKENNMSEQETKNIDIKIDYKDTKYLSKFISERGKIIPSRVSGMSLKRQRQLSQAIKRARILALLPFVAK